jgi:hypothetical protein
LLIGGALTGCRERALTNFQASFLNQSTEDPLRGRTYQKLVLATLLILLSIANVACGGKLEGTYSNVAGNVTLELRSGGKAALTLNGETQNCGWKSDSQKVTVTCGGDSMDFGIHDDGSLTGPTMVGVMRKSKS